MRPATVLAAALLAVPSAAAGDEDAGCPAVGAGRIEAALDQATYTEESIVQGVSSSNSPRWIDLRFSLEQAWEPRWTCHTWEVELVLPPCVEAHNPEGLTGTDVNKRTGLRNDKAHWTLKLDEAAEEAGEAADAECSNHRQSSPTYLAWYRVRVLDSNSNVHVAFKDGRTHRLYPARLKLMWHR